MHVDSKNKINIIMNTVQYWIDSNTEQRQRMFY